MNARIASSLAVAALLALTTLVVVGRSASATAAPSVSGGGAGPLDSDRVQVQLNARGTDGTASGRFNIVHHKPTGSSPTSPATPTVLLPRDQPRS